ncbi:hypothetical protein FJT64_014293 [Amphibalanus amphitrite]|uniref:Uncharacterized protein n=1 Tax=Amphibalanus amphitrite TaxID=1232801 RepID=A0A6A4UZT4_AMPAM|nr:hypothetical protein FJT64_014293 [Amphibalanus amphitrite]
MSATRCPFEDCSYSIAEDTDANVVVQLLRMHEAASHARPSVSFTADKVRRPQVSAAGSSEEWTYFLSRWTDYKEAVHLTGSDCVLQLLECCDEALRRDLTRASGGSLATKPEKDVLAAMRRLAVREENTMVARVALQNMTQDTDESIRTFAARLRGQAAVCHFTIQCPNSACGKDISYQDEVIRDIIARGINDSDIQLELLGNHNQHMSLEETISFIEAKETDGADTFITDAVSVSGPSAHTSHPIAFPRVPAKPAARSTADAGGVRQPALTATTDA